jgi:hypothetical protein
MKKLLIRLGLSVLGTVATLLWWTYHDKGSSAQSMSHIPAKVADGGNQLVIEVEGSTASTLRIDFEDLGKPVSQQILLNAWEKVPAGPHTWTVDIPSGIGGYIEFEADHPNPGDTLTQRVKINGKEVDSQTDKLDSALEPNTAFFVQFQRNDFSHAEAMPEE